MKKIGLAVMLGLLLTSATYSQRISPLFQVMSSSSLIDRPTEFREMQLNITKEVGDTKPGFRATPLFKKLNELEDQLLEKIVAPKIENLGGTYELKLCGQFFSPQIKWDTNTMKHKSIGAIFDTIHSRLKSIIESQIDIAINEIKTSETKQAFLSSLLSHLKNSEINIVSEKYKLSGSPSEIAAEFISEYAEEKTIEVLRAKNPDKVITPSTKIDTLLDSLMDRVNELFVTATNSVKEKISDAFTKVENELYSAADSFSKLLISSNAGISISDGGNASGGLYLTFMVAEYLQLGIFTNAELPSSKESKDITPEQSMYGLRCQLAFCDRLAVDVLGSYLYGNEKTESWRSSELGLGLSYNPGKVIVGAAYYWLNVGSDDKAIPSTTKSFGLTAKLSNPSSPTFFIGNSWTDDFGKGKMSFGLSYPLLSNQ